MLRSALTLSAIIGFGLVVPGCSQANSETLETTPAQTVPQIHAAILEIIESGDKAKAAKDGKALSQAAALLAQLGAKPFDTDTPDLINDWRKAASNMQADAPAYRGRVKGPAYRKKVLAPGAHEVLEEIYYASEKAELTLKALSGGVLALRIAEQPSQDNNDTKPVCTLRIEAAPASCQWLPLWTAKYNITITNNSQQPIPYLLVTN